MDFGVFSRFMGCPCIFGCLLIDLWDLLVVLGSSYGFFRSHGFLGRCHRLFLRSCNVFLGVLTVFRGLLVIFGLFSWGFFGNALVGFGFFWDLLLVSWRSSCDFWDLVFSGSLFVVSGISSWTFRVY